MSNLKPCPFCGGTKVVVGEGSTFRWLVAQCAECGAQAGEARVQTMGSGTPAEWRIKGEADAIEVWNTRAADQPAAAAEPVWKWGDTPGINDHIEFCAACHYSRAWTAEHGHGESCPHRAADNSPEGPA